MMIFPWQKWKKLAYTDDLTGVWNRRYLFSREWENKRFRYLYFVDINDLGEINKREGFLAGDRVIKETANKLKEYVTDSLICRIGGDEFVVLSNSPFLDDLPRVVNATVVAREITNSVTNSIGLLIQSASLECAEKKELVEA